MKTATTTSVWGTLRQPRFRGLWSGGGLYFLGNAMLGMAAAWMIVERTGSSFLAALVQTALFMPMFALALPAGVLADITDRRRLIQGALLTQAATQALLTLLVLAGQGSAALLLFFVFVGGCCTALLSPAWNSAVADSMPREQMPQAITAVAIAYNAARAIGPALAGFLFAAAGGAWVFAVTVLTALAMYESVRRWPPAPHPPSRLPAERLWGGTLSGLRFARHSHIVLSQLVRTVACGGAGSALWALLPVIALRQLGSGAEGFGLLIGCLGIGAVGAGLVVGRVRARIGLEALVGGGCLVYAAVMVVAGFSRWAWVSYLALVIGGAAWMVVMSTFNVATQTSVPPWVRSRAVAMHTVAALGSIALGSALWGALSGLVGLQVALGLAAAAMAACVLLARPFPLRMGDEQEVTQAVPFEDFFIADEPDPGDGPVAVEIGYRVRPHDADRFLETVEKLRAPRRRDGATFWRVYRDLSDPTRYVERFIVSSWADYLHQRARGTLADQELESQVRAFLLAGESASLQHYIAER